MVDQFRGCGVRVRLVTPDNFLKVKETLTRIGVASPKTNTLYQSCHILHKRNALGESEYAICHFKEMFLFDGKVADIDVQDYARRNTIANLLAQWGLVELVDPVKSQDPIVPVNHLKILPFRDKEHWSLVTKYTVGKKVMTI